MRRSRRRRGWRLSRSMRTSRILSTDAGQVARARGRARKGGLVRRRLREKEGSGGCAVAIAPSSGKILREESSENSDGLIDLMNRWIDWTTRLLRGWLIRSDSIQNYLPVICQNGMDGWFWFSATRQEYCRYQQDGYRKRKIWHAANKIEM